MLRPGAAHVYCVGLVTPAILAGDCGEPIRRAQHPRYTGGANCGTQYPVWRGDLSHFARVRCNPRTYTTWALLSHLLAEVVHQLLRLLQPALTQTLPNTEGLFCQGECVGVAPLAELAERSSGHSGA